MSPTTFTESIQLDKLSPTLFQSKHNPESNGSTMLGDIIAFGGTTLAMAVNAAHATVPPGFLIYSATGIFLSPALTTAPLKFKVTPLRDTRTFATRQILVLQQREEDKPERAVLSMTADFQTPERKGMLEYTPRLKAKYSRWEDCYTLDDVKNHAARQLPDGAVPEMMAQVFDSSYGSTRKYFSTRLSPESVTAQTFAGFLPQLPTSADGVHITEQVQVNWFKANHEVQSAASHAAATAYILDAGSAALPPVLAKKELSTITAASSLDFALRFFTADINVNDLLLREDRTVQGKEGRTYSEARLWSPDGRLLAGMTQQCILRGQGEVAKL